MVFGDRAAWSEIPFMPTLYPICLDRIELVYETGHLLEEVL